MRRRRPRGPVWSDPEPAVERRRQAAFFIGIAQGVLPLDQSHPLAGPVVLLGGSVAFALDDLFRDRERCRISALALEALGEFLEDAQPQLAVLTLIAFGPHHAFKALEVDVVARVGSCGVAAERGEAVISVAAIDAAKSRSLQAGRSRIAHRRRAGARRRSWLRVLW